MLRLPPRPLVSSLLLLAVPLACNGDDAVDTAGQSATASATASATEPTTASPTTTTTPGTGTDTGTASATGTSGTTQTSDPSTSESDSTGGLIFDVGADTDTDTGDTGGDVITCLDAASKPSNIGCEFWAVDMDQQDAFNDPASAPWGVAISPIAGGQTNVTIEINLAAPGEPLDLMIVEELSIGPDEVVPVELPTRELDCGLMPNDYMAPGTCLSSNAFRISSTYRVVGWPAGHPIKLFDIIDRSALTIVGTQPDTKVTVKPSFRIKGNPPVPPIPGGGAYEVTLGPFDVLNLETADGSVQDDSKTIADLTGSVVLSDKPVAVFSGVESTAAPGGVISIPTHDGWTEGDSCCLDHLEEQLFPVESIGKDYVITRSPIRSTGEYHEPDVIRFLGVAEDAKVTTNLPPPYDMFTLSPGEVRTTWADADFVATGTKPFMVAQLLISQEYVDGPYTGDPALTVFPPVDQYRDEYRILTPADDGLWGWAKNYVVISAPPESVVTIDDVEPGDCVVSPAGTVNGEAYESRRCPVSEGVHSLKGDSPFGVIAYGYGPAGSYAFPGGADAAQIYQPPQ